MPEDTGVAQLLETTSGDQQIAVASTSTVQTQSIKTREFGSNFGLVLDADSGGVIAVTVQLQVSHDNSQWSIPNNWPNIDSLTDGTLKSYLLSIPPFPFMRIQFTGTGSNAASTVVKAWISGQRTK